MAMEFKDILMHLKMVIRFSYRTARAHFYISSMLFFLLLLYRIFPSLFAFLVSSSPVIICTGVLLGTLLSFGSPNIPQLEEEDDEIMINQKISSVQVEKSDTDDIIVQREGRINAAVDITKDFSFRKGHGGNDDIIGMEENDDDKNEVVGLTLNIANDGPFDSSLGSPWQPVDTDKAYSNSDSESDGSESSSDASMTDILPMLDELHPLLDSENSQPILTSYKSSDLSSNELSHDNESSHDHQSSHDHESEEDNVTKEAELTKSKTEEDSSNEVAVAWNENDQNNVMDLGYSEIERNRRLENLIARRRLRKLQSQKYDNEKNLIDLESFYPTSIPSISAPRRNPFDFPQDYDSNLNIPPIPGSAPSVMQPRHNPFDLPYDQTEEIGTMSGEYLKHHDFISDAQRDMLSRRVDNFTSRPSFLGITTFERQLSGESDFKISFASGSDVDSPFKGRHEELNESEIRQERSTVSPINSGDESVEQEGQNIDQVAELNVSSDVTGGEVGVQQEGHEIFEENSVDSDSSSSSESIESISEMNVRDELINMGGTTDDPIKLNKGHDFAQNNAVTIEGSGCILVQSSVPSISDINRSRGIEISEMKEHKLDVDQNMRSEDADDNSLASFVQADISNVAAQQNLLETSLSLEDQNPAKLESMEENLQENVPRLGDISDTIENSVDMDKNIQPDTSYTTEESSSVSESEVSLSSKSLGEEPQSHNSDNHSVDINLTDNQRKVINESIASASVDSQVEEPNAYMSNIEHDTGSSNKPSVSDIKFESEIIGEHKEEPLKDSFSPDIERENEISSDTDLAELDAVGDFHFSREMKSNQEQGQNDNLHLGDDPEMTVYNPNLRVLDACSFEELDSVFKQHNEATFLPGVENSKASESEIVATGSGSSVTDVDMIVLEAKSIEDINTALKQQTVSGTEQNILNVEEKSNVEVTDTYPEYTDKDSEQNILNVEEKSNIEVTDTYPEYTDTDSEQNILNVEEKSNVEVTDTYPEYTDTDLIVLEAKSIDDIDSALEHHIVSEQPTNLEVDENNDPDASGMIVLEAKSVEDISTALKKQTEGSTEQSTLNVEDKTNAEVRDVCPDNKDTDIDSALEHHILGEDPTNLEVEEHSNVEAADMIVLEAQSVEDITMAFKKETEGSTELNILEVGENSNLEARDKDTDMFVLETKSTGEFNAASKQHAENVKEQDILEVEESKSKKEDMDSDSELHVVEAKSIDDIDLAVNQLGPHIEVGPSGRQEVKLDHIENAEKSNDKIDRVIVADDVSGPSMLKKNQKEKSNGSDSDLSSSSSSLSESE